MTRVTVTVTGLSERKREDGLASNLSEAVGQVLGLRPEDVVVVLGASVDARWPAALGVRTGDPNTLAAAELVRAFLRAVEMRDLDRARTMLVPGFRMTFPGDRTFSRLEELVDWARRRYRHARKTYERFDEAPGDDGVAVYCYGTLAGEWLDGVPFSGIRFVDRFTVRDGQLVDQRVWNDLAEVRAGDGPPPRSP
jgi:hypothetical protein